MSRRDVDECGAHREGLGRCWPKSSVKGERLRFMTLEELGSTSGIFLLVFRGSCGPSWANGVAGTRSEAVSVFRMNRQESVLTFRDLRVQYSYNAFINSLYNSVDILNRLGFSCEGPYSIPDRGKFFILGVHPP